MVAPVLSVKKDLKSGRLAHAGDGAPPVLSLKKELKSGRLAHAGDGAPPVLLLKKDLKSGRLAHAGDGARKYPACRPEFTLSIKVSFSSTTSRLGNAFTIRG
jgi:hypothetical protein